jgi:hypothetical protein
MTPTCATCRRAETWPVGFWFWRRERPRPYGICLRDAAGGADRDDVRADGGPCGVDAKLWEGRT